MSEPLGRFILVHDFARQRAVQAVQHAPEGHEVIVREQRRNNDQNARLHAMFDDVSRQYVHVGRKWDAESTKRLLVSAFKEDTKDDPELALLWKEMGDITLVPAIRGGGFVVLGAQTRKFPKKLASAFIEWMFAFGAENDIEWTEPRARKEAA